MLAEAQKSVAEEEVRVVFGYQKDKNKWQRRKRTYCLVSRSTKLSGKGESAYSVLLAEAQKHVAEDEEACVAVSVLLAAAQKNAAQEEAHVVSC